MTNKTISQILVDCGCLWTHDNPPKYYAQLVSGLHSNGFINMRNLYTTDIGIQGLDKIMMIVAEKLVYNGHISKDFVTVGAAYGGIIPAYLLAKHLGISSIWTEKQDDGSQLSKFTLHGKKVFIVEDVLTTGSTVLKVMAAVRSAGGEVVDPIICIVNRSGNNYVESRRLFSGMSLSIKNYSSESCPWCKKGSLAIKPKFDNNWNKLITQEG